MQIYNSQHHASIEGYPDIESDLVRQVESVAADTARRIGERVVREGFHSSSQLQPVALDMYMPASASFREFWVTDRPDQIYASTPLYTVTSSLALETPIQQEGVLLWSPIDHAVDGIRTHRGFGLGIFSEFMEQLGIKLGRKDYFLWFGSEIDGEQLKLEDEIARRGPETDNEILSIFFNMSDVDAFMRSSDGHVHLHPQLAKMAQSISSRKMDTYAQDPESRQYVDRLLEGMRRNMGVRDGWFNALEAILKNEQQSEVSPDLNIDKFERELIQAAKNNLPIPKPSRAIVLEIDPHKIFEQIPIYVFPLSARPPDTIVPVPMLPAEAVTAIYIESPLELPERFQALQKPLGMLAAQSWLTDATGRYVDLTLARSIETDPRTPLCAVRYAHPPVATWANHISLGNIAPWWQDVSVTDLRDPSDMAEQSLRQLILTKARVSGLVEQLISVAGSEWLAEELILTSSGRVKLPSVRSVTGLEGAMLYKR
jgi:hypothetical protein